MKNYRLDITRRALADLKRIEGYIAKDSPQNARSMINRLFDAIELLKHTPHRTIVRHQSASLRCPVRSLPVEPYTVFFRVLEHEDSVRVLTVRHSARTPPKRLG